MIFLRLRMALVMSIVTAALEAPFLPASSTPLAMVLSAPRYAPQGPTPYFDSSQGGNAMGGNYMGGMGSMGGMGGMGMQPGPYQEGYSLSFGQAIGTPAWTEQNRMRQQTQSNQATGLQQYRPGRPQYLRQQGATPYQSYFSTTVPSRSLYGAEDRFAQRMFNYNQNQGGGMYYQDQRMNPGYQNYNSYNAASPFGASNYGNSYPVTQGMTSGSSQYDMRYDARYGGSLPVGSTRNDNFQSTMYTQNYENQRNMRYQDMRSRYEQPGYQNQQQQQQYYQSGFQNQQMNQAPGMPLDLQNLGGIPFAPEFGGIQRDHGSNVYGSGGAQGLRGSGPMNSQGPVYGAQQRAQTSYSSSYSPVQGGAAGVRSPMSYAPAPPVYGAPTRAQARQTVKTNTLYPPMQMSQMSQSSIDSGLNRRLAQRQNYGNAGQQGYGNLGQPALGNVGPLAGGYGVMAPQNQYAAGVMPPQNQNVGAQTGPGYGTYPAIGSDRNMRSPGLRNNFYDMPQSDFKKPYGGR